MVDNGPVYVLGEDRPVLPEDGSVWIAPTAAVIGRVTLGADVGVWFGAVIRGDSDAISVGERTNIQDGAVLHADPGSPLVIGADVTVGHRAILHGCTIGDNVLVGMGACVMNGAKIGRNCVIGAGALVTEGKEFPDNSLIVGSPAKAVRSIEPSAEAGLTRSAANYVDKARLYAVALKGVGPASSVNTP